MTTEPTAKVDEGQVVPTIGAIQTDVGFANQYRLELIKTTFLVASGLLAFTVAFRPSIPSPKWEGLMWTGWIALGVSAIGAMGNMYGWERYFASFRDHKSDQEKGRNVRRVITSRRRVAMAFQFAGFAVGVLCIALFAAANIDSARLK